MEEKLRKQQDHLAELVEKRTADLEETNRKLQEEITERKKTVETLGESEEHYRSIFKQAADSIERG